MPLTEQQVVYVAMEETRTVKGVPPSYAALGVPATAAAVDTKNLNFDAYRKLWTDSVSIRALLVEPVATQPAAASLPDGSGSVIRTLFATGEVDVTSFAVDSATGILVTQLGGPAFSFAVDPAYRANFPSGQAISPAPSAVISAAKRWRPSERVTWTMTIATNGSLVVSTPGPQVVSQPQARSFAEGVATQFTVDIDDHIGDGTGAHTYAVQNADETALTGYTLNSLVGSVATLTSPSSPAGAKDIRFKKTDANGKSDFVIGVYTVVANPEIQVLSTPPSFPNVVIGSIFSFPLAASTVFFDTEALTYSLRNSDDTPPPAGYAWDGTNLTGPVEGGAVLRTFKLKAVEQGALARAMLSPSFTVDRVASPVVIVSPVDPVSWPENAATTRRVDVRTALGTDAAEDITIPANLAGKVVKTPVGSGVFDLVGTFANNEILSGTATYSGTLGGNPLQGTPIFKSVHNPPVAGVINVSALNDGPITLTPVAVSDDPANNLIVSGSVSVNIGTATLSADRKTITLDPTTGLIGPAVVSYTLEATAGGPTTAATASVNWNAVQPPRANQAVMTTSVDGTPMTPVPLLPFFSAGSYPLDPASLQFADISTGDLLGKSVVIPGVGTFTIDANNAFALAGASGYSGTSQLYLDIADVKGNHSGAASLKHTQSASTPTGTPFPNTLDGKPIIGVGLNHYEKFQYERPFNNHWLLLDSFDMDTNLKSASEKIEDGSFDPVTGRVTLIAGESWQMPRVRYLQSLGFPTLDAGEWAIKFRFTGTVAMTTLAGFAESGSTGSVKRYVRTFTGSDTGGVNPVISGVGDFYPDYCGLSALEADRRAVAAHFKTYCSGNKVIRPMDWFRPDRSLVFFANEMVQANDHFVYGDSSKWGALSANRSKRRGGFDPLLWYSLMAEIGRMSHVNFPLSLGFGSVETEWRAATNNNSVAFDAAVASNIATIEADVYQQNFLAAQAYFQAMNTAALPDYVTQAFEQGLEQWNGAKGPQFRAARAIGRAKGKVSQQAQYGMGWLHVLATKGWRDAKAQTKPGQLMKYVIGCQTQVIGNGQQVIDAWKAYIQANPTTAPPISELSLADYGYWRVAHRWLGVESPGDGNPWGAATEAELVAAYAASNAAGGESGLFDDFRSWNLDTTKTKGLNIYGVLADHQAYFDLCAANGCEYYGTYEGGPDDGLPPSALLATDPQTSAFAPARARNWPRSLQAYDVQKKYIEEFFARFPNAVCMNYFEVGPGGSGAGLFWSEKTPTEINTLVPNTVSAAWDEFKTSAPAGGGGSGGGGGYVEIDRTILSSDTIAGLNSEGFTTPAGSAIANVGARDALLIGGVTLNSATDLKEMSVRIRPSSPLNANLALEIDILILAPQWNDEYGSFFLHSIATGTRAQCGVNALGHFTVAQPGNNDNILVTTSGVNFLDGAWHQLKIVYFIDRTVGLIEVRDRVTNALLGSFAGDTNPLAIANLNLDGLIVRGRRYISRLKGVTP